MFNYRSKHIVLHYRCWHQENDNEFWIFECLHSHSLAHGNSESNICHVSSGLSVFPRSPEHNRMEQRHGGDPERVLLQQLDDPAIPAAPAALHPAQLLPLPEVSDGFRSFGVRAVHKKFNISTLCCVCDPVLYQNIPQQCDVSYLNGWCVCLLGFRISESIRIAGSLVFILLLFVLTAVLVKVPMEMDLFFSVTMATIWFINCKSVRLCVCVKAWQKEVDLVTVLNGALLPLLSVWCRAAGQSVRPGGSAASEVQRRLHERPGPRWNLCCHRHAVSHRQ